MTMGSNVHSARRTWRQAVVLLIAALPVFAQTPAEDFRRSCANCHTIGGGRLTGPDLKDVTQRQPRAWLVRFINNPKAVIDSGDATAAKLLAEANGAIMPTPSAMTPERANALLDLIEAESKLPESQFVGLKITDKPFSADDLAQGERLFFGRAPFSKGGPACVACHSAGSLPGLGGGRLGPDLTRVYERIQGRQALAAWLQAPPTPTMKQVFGSRPLETAEILSLLAFIEQGAAVGTPLVNAARVVFTVGGLVGCAVLLFVFDGIWRRRFTAVRRPLVEQARMKVRQ